MVSDGNHLDRSIGRLEQTAADAAVGGPAGTRSDPAPASAGRTAGGQYAPGRSGNPAGRPAAAREVREAAGCHTLAAVAVLAEVLHDPGASQSMRFRAAQSMLRAAGQQRDDDEEEQLAARAAERAEDAAQRAVRMERLADQEALRQHARVAMGLRPSPTLVAPPIYPPGSS